MLCSRSSNSSGQEVSWYSALHGAVGPEESPLGSDELVPECIKNQAVCSQLLCAAYTICFLFGFCRLMFLFVGFLCSVHAL